MTKANSLPWDKEMDVRKAGLFLYPKTEHIIIIRIGFAIMIIAVKRMIKAHCPLSEDNVRFKPKLTKKIVEKKSFNGVILEITSRL